MKNVIHILSRKKCHFNFSIPYGQIILAIVPAFVFLFVYKILLLFLNRYYPSFIIEIRHFVRLNLGFIYNNTYGTYIAVFVFFMILTMVFFSLMKGEKCNSKFA